MSERHVARIVRGDSRAQLLGLDVRTLNRSAVEAVDRLLDGLELEVHDHVAAAAARGLAEKIDALRGAETAAAAAALPALVRELNATLEPLRRLTARPSPLDEIRRRRDERRAAMMLAAGNTERW